MFACTVPIDHQQLIWVAENDHFKDDLHHVQASGSAVVADEGRAKPLTPNNHNSNNTSNGNNNNNSSSRQAVSIRNENFYDHYFYENDIGEGRFGAVYQCCRADDVKQRAAAKSILLNSRSNLQNRAAVQREIDMLNRLHHPVIPVLRDAFCMSNREIILVMDMIEGGELFDRIADRHFILTELAGAMIIGQLCEAARYIHSQFIIHFDIKPENIMFKSLEGNRIVLIDFGLSQEYRPNMQVLAGTAEFIAPEVTKYETVCYKSDIWSIGVITYILLSGFSPFLGDTDCETYANVQEGDYEITPELFPEISKDALDFIQLLLTYDRLARPSAAECLAHRWLRWHERHGDTPSLQTTRLRQYVARRRWKRYVHAIIAASTLTKLGSASSSKRNSSTEESSS